MSNDRSDTPHDPADSEFCERVRAELERESSALDAVTRARLAAARHRALAVAGNREHGRWLPWVGAAVAASLLLAVVLDRGAQAPTIAAPSAAVSPVSVQATVATSPPAVIASDVAVIADLEFYDWLEAQDAVL